MGLGWFARKSLLYDLAWLLLFHSLGPLHLASFSWEKHGSDFSRGKVALRVLLVPLLHGLALQFIGPYFYPITWGEDGHSMYMRFLPIIGGRGYHLTYAPLRLLLFEYA
jgi:hypothetical protein